MDEIAQIKQRVDIVDLINEFIPLKKAGRNFKSPCPFHQEKSPSFTVSPERQIYHCFGCSKGGDVFQFLIDYENIDFSESLKILANKAGITLSVPVFRSETEKKKELIYGLNQITAQFYNYLLTKHTTGKSALLYLTDKRKVSPELINTFMLGFAPENGSPLTEYLIKKKKYKEEDLLLAGLSFRSGSRLFDFFRNRIIFPIIDVRGNVIAFSGRTLSATDDSGPKYINTKETPAYIKGDTLFGINLAKDAIKKEKKAILVEGEFDVISAFKEGIRNIAAVKGTALTENQIKLLKRFTPKISFCFDTDMAGTEAQRRSIELIEKEGVAATVIVPPSGKDPDEILNENPLAFKKAVKNDINVYDFIIDSAVLSFDKKTSEGKSSILSKTLPFLAAIDNEVIKEHYLKKLSNQIDASFESVSKQSEKIKIVEKPQVAKQDTKDQSREEKVETYLLSLIIQSKNIPDTILKVKKIMENTPFTTIAIDKIWENLFNFAAQEKIFTLEKFVTTLPSELLNFFDLCYLSPIPEFIDSEIFNQELEKTTKVAKFLCVKKELRDIEKKIREMEKNGDEKEIEELKEKFNFLSHNLKRLSP